MIPQNDSPPPRQNTWDSYASAGWAFIIVTLLCFFGTWALDIFLPARRWWGILPLNKGFGLSVCFLICRLAASMFIGFAAGYLTEVFIQRSQRRSRIPDYMLAPRPSTAPASRNEAPSEAPEKPVS